MSLSVIRLTPNTFDARPKSFSLGERAWRRAVQMVDKAGYRPNIVGAIGKRDVAPFAKNLRLALATQAVPEEDRPELEKLLEYLTGTGANVGGLELTTSLRKWNEQ